MDALPLWRQFSRLITRRQPCGYRGVAGIIIIPDKHQMFDEAGRKRIQALSDVNRQKMNEKIAAKQPAYDSILLGCLCRWLATNGNWHHLFEIHKSASENWCLSKSLQRNPVNVGVYPPLFKGDDGKTLAAGIMSLMSDLSSLYYARPPMNISWHIGEGKFDEFCITQISTKDLPTEFLTRNLLAIHYKDKWYSAGHPKVDELYIPLHNFMKNMSAYLYKMDDKTTYDDVVGALTKSYHQSGLDKAVEAHRAVVARPSVAQSIKNFFFSKQG